MTQFYIYVHCRPSGEPFNVGKGQGKRAHDFKNNRNQHFKNVVKKYGSVNILTYVRNCKSEKQAHQHEIWMIAYGRAQGWRLCNQTDGGDGIAGYKFSNKSKAVMRAIKLGKKLPTAHLENLRLACKKLTHREKLSTAGKANWADPAYCKMMAGVRWEDPKYREKQASVQRSKEYIARQSATSKANWKDTRFVTHQLASRKAYWQSSASNKQRKDKTAILKVLWADTTFRAQHSARVSDRNKRRWQDPLYRAAMVAMCREREARKREALRQIVKARKVRPDKV